MRKSLPILLCIVLSVPLFAADGKLSADDVAQIKKLQDDYCQAWLRNEPDGVRAVFVEDSVLLPHHGVEPKVGRTALNQFWFPPNAPPTKVLELGFSPESISGDGQIAYSWGKQHVSWVSKQGDKETTVSMKGTYLMVLEKQSDGKWKISRFMWDDPLPQQR